MGYFVTTAIWWWVFLRACAVWSVRFPKEAVKAILLVLFIIYWSVMTVLVMWLEWNYGPR